MLGADRRSARLHRLGAGLARQAARRCAAPPGGHRLALGAAIPRLRAGSQHRRLVRRLRREARRQVLSGAGRSRPDLVVTQTAGGDDPVPAADRGDETAGASQQDRLGWRTMADRLLGSFVWCELMTTDTAAADSFYKKVVGWTSVPFAPDGSYTVFNNPSGAGVGGLMKLPDREADGRAAALDDVRRDAERRPDRDADRAARRPRAQTAGRHSQHRPLRGGPGPLRRELRDLPAAADPGPAGRPVGVGDFSWFELYTPNPEAAWKFYETLFAGRRPPPWTWARWASTRCSDAAAASPTAGS